MNILKKYKAPQLIIAFVLFWTPVIVFLRIAGEIVEKEHIGIDTYILSWIHAHANPVLDQVFFAVTMLGNIEVILPVSLLILAFFLFKKQRRNALILFFGVGGAAAANLILKLSFQRDRPTFWQSMITETGYSFPSGHAMVTSALVLCLIVILWQTKWRIASIVIGSIVIVLVGISRLYLGVHYPTDVIAGWSVSAIWVAIIAVIVKFASYEFHKRDTPQANSNVKATTPNSRSSSSE